VTDRIRSLIEAGWLVADPATDEEVIGLWNKALGAWADAHVTANTDDARIIRTYDAGRLAATSLVRAYHLRVRAQNHHEHTLRTAALLGTGELRHSLDEFDRVRRLRSEAEYGWQSSSSGTPLSRGIELVGRILVLACTELRLSRPELAERIKHPEQ
jgi:hypothetical protein